MGLMILLLFVLVADSGAEDPFEDYIFPDQITLNPIILVFKTKKLSWNDANHVCATSYINQTLVTALNDADVHILNLTASSNISPIWLGLVSSSHTSPEPTWVTCQPYSDDDYEQPFQKANNTFSPTKRCALLINSLWEWRDCSEPHGFVCSRDDFAGDAEVPADVFPTCGQNDVNYCPRTLSDATCFPESHVCMMEANSASADKKLLTFLDLKVSWNEAVDACTVNVMRLAVLDSPDKQRQSTAKANEGLWMGLYRHVRHRENKDNTTTMFLSAVWVNCNEYVENSDTYLFQRQPSVLPPLNKRCALIVDDHWEWRDCRERHGFICEDNWGEHTEDYKLYWDKVEDLRSCPDPRANCSVSSCSEDTENTENTENTQNGTAFCVKDPLQTTTATTATTEETTITPTVTYSTTTSSPDTTNASKSIATTTDTSSTTDTTVEDGTTTITTELSPTPYVSTTTEPIHESSTIAEPSQFACNTSCHCRCNCVKTVYVSPDEWVMAKESKSRWISSVLEGLSPNKSSFSSNRRRYKSVEDPRESVTTIGSLGVIFLVVVFTGILLLDMSALVTDFSMLIGNLRHVFRR